VTESSGNVFADLGTSGLDEELAKAQVASRIRQTIKRKRLTQVQAGQRLGLDQPKVSALINGRLPGFSNTGSSAAWQHSARL
jgi:predicted XRE-type DNA-binding protein